MLFFPHFVVDIAFSGATLVLLVPLPYGFKFLRVFGAYIFSYLTCYIGRVPHVPNCPFTISHIQNTLFSLTRNDIGLYILYRPSYFTLLFVYFFLRMFVFLNLYILCVPSCQKPSSCICKPELAVFSRYLLQFFFSLVSLT